MTVPTSLSEPRTPADSPPSAPALPGHYEVRGRLGEGGFGQVYEAWDSKLRRPVAIKCFRQAGAELMREARVGAALRHPAFVKVHAIEDDGDTQAIVMELVPGRTLKQVLADGPVARADALDWTRQIAEAMLDAHDAGLVHGDLKPSNLMLEPGGAIRILDFGLAHSVDVLATALMPTGALQGTIAYMAPERMMGAQLSPQADVYALGLILYEMVNGARPFAALDGLALAAAQVQGSSDGWSYPADASPQLVALIRAMTARQPAQRLAGMAEVRERLAQLDAPAAPDAAAPPAPRTPRAPMPSRTRKLLAGAALLALLGGAGWIAAPQLDTLAPALAPFSESAEMEQGLAALKVFDRPGSLAAAEKHFRRILERTPDSAAAAAGMSLTYSMRYQTDKSDETWLQRADAGAQRAAQLNEQLALSHNARAWVLFNQGKREEALGAYAEALRLDPNNFFAWYGQGATLRRMHRYDEARTQLQAAIARFPDERVFTDELGSVEYEQSDYAAAERLFRRSIALQPDAVIAYANLNAALLRQGRDDEALRVLQQGLQIRPSAKLYTNLGNALFLRQDYVGAAAAFENAVSPTRGAPAEYQLWANLADTLNWIPGREAQARAAYNKARELLAPRLARAPDDVLMVSRMGLYAARTGDADQAAILLPRALELAPNSADVHFRAGLAYELLGQRDAALAAIHSARRLGYPVKFIDAEPDLVALRRDERYVQADGPGTPRAGSAHSTK